MGEFIASYKSTRQNNLETFFTLYFLVKIINWHDLGIIT